ncbi:MAG: D-alanyl-D-alanine carboxypeptidase/D-alanyl-D-alanine-endopeptidase [Fimbriimonadales bacterium]|nr:D-alanyl-D-alanine carboxypeptidase/D-alanyl-D-alanine-endopeptidase [Fimbriimonadales bacterium]
MLSGLALLLAGSAPIQAVQPMAELLQHPSLKGSIVAVSVLGEDGRVLLQNEDATRVMPASNMKLFTVAYALHRLGPEHRFRTRLFRVGDEVWVDAVGDPTLTSEVLRDAGRKLGVRRHTRVRPLQAYWPGVPQGWNHGYLTARYAAQVEAWSVDRGGFEVWADARRIWLRHDHGGVRLRHVPDEKPLRVSYDRVGRSVTVRGSLPKEPQRVIALASPDPSEAACRALGGTEAAPPQALPDREPDLVLESPPLSRIAAMCLQPSDNNIAEHLLLAAARTEGPLNPEDPYPQATDRLVRFATQVAGVDADDLRPWDGSGLSRHDLVTARSLTRLLQWALGQPWGEVWLQAQAQAGGEGTLANRLRGLDFRGKTGYIDAVASLSGYLRRPDGRLLIMAVVCNHFKRPASEARQAIDRFVEELSRATEFGTTLEPGRGDASSPVPFAGSGLAVGDRLAGSGVHGLAPRAWPHRRDEPTDAPADRAQRTLVRNR